MLTVLTFSCLPFTLIYFIYTEVFLRPRNPGLVIMYHHLNYTMHRQIFQLTILLHRRLRREAGRADNIRPTAVCALLVVGDGALDVPARPLWGGAVCEAD